MKKILVLAVVLTALFAAAVFADTATVTPTTTQTVTPTITATNTGTNTPSITLTKTPTATNTGTQTVTPTITKTATPTYTKTATKTWTPSPLPSATTFYRKTSTPTLTVTQTSTWYASPTSTPTITKTPTRTPTPGYKYPAAAKFGLDGGIFTDANELEQTTNIMIMVSPTPNPNLYTNSAMPYYLSPTAAWGYPAASNSICIKGIDIVTDASTGQIYVYASRTAQVGGVPLAVNYPNSFSNRISTGEMHIDLAAGEPIVVSATALGSGTWHIFVRIKYKIESPQWDWYKYTTVTSY